MFKFLFRRFYFRVEAHSIFVQDRLSDIRFVVCGIEVFFSWLILMKMKS